MDLTAGRRVRPRHRVNQRQAVMYRVRSLSPLLQFLGKVLTLKLPPLILLSPCSQMSQHHLSALFPTTYMQSILGSDPYSQLPPHLQLLPTYNMLAWITLCPASSYCLPFRLASSRKSFLNSTGLLVLLFCAPSPPRADCSRTQLPASISVSL